MVSQELSTNPIALVIRHDRQIGAERRTVDARDLHAKLEVARDFSTWIKGRIEEYDFVQGVDFEVFTGFGENPQGGRPAIEYALTTTMAKELAMVERSAIGRAVRRYFIAAEQRMRNLEAEIDRSATLSTPFAKLRLVETVRTEAGDNAAARAWRAARLPDLARMGLEMRPGEEPADAVKRRLRDYLREAERFVSFDELFCSATAGAVSKNDLYDALEDLVFQREIITNIVNRKACYRLAA